MKPHPPDKIRNVALVGHGGAGKTTLAEALLHAAGAIGRTGRVENGTTVCDFEPEEHDHHMSLSLAVAPIEWKNHKINLIDTPGYADFVNDVHAALRVADLAVFVVSAVEGVQVQTEAIWRLATRLGVPRMVFVNKLDRERASFGRTLDQLRSRFGAGVAPLELPIGEEAAFCGVADLLTDTAWTYGDGSPTRGDIPKDMEATEHEVHDNLVEGIVVADDDLLAGYLDGEVPSLDQLERTLAVGVDDATVFPVVCGSATTGVGVDRLADFLCEIGPSPLDRPPIEVEAGDRLVEVEADPAGRPLALVFKTLADRFVGHISVFKVLSGSVRPDEQLINTRTGAGERLHAVHLLRGHEQLPADLVPVGDIAAVAKLGATATGDTLAPKDLPVRVPPLELAPPVLTVAVVARTQSDDDKLGEALHRLQDEDPALVVDRDDETHQMLLRGVGETHLGVTREKLARKFGVQVGFEEVRIAYRETVTAEAEAQGRFKKQSGGHGQFGVVDLRIAPLDRGEGFRFVDKVVGGAIPRPFIPAVEKGIVETMADGGQHGYPVVDVEVTCLDGKYHPVDSSEMSFRMAGRLAFKEALAKASPVVLEPVARLTVTVPPGLQGDVIGDLNARRGRVQGTDTGTDGDQTIVALVPSAELARYAVDLRSLTAGRGRFSQVHDHYEVVPAHVVVPDRHAEAGP